MVKKALQLLFLCTTAAFCDQVSVSDFVGLNNNEAALIIAPQYAQDLLNVDVTPGGKSVKKRPGFGVYKDIDTGGVHGGNHFYDSTGNDVQVWGSSKSLTGIVADGTPTVLVSSATEGATWDCADTQGFAYCVNSSRDVYVRTTGAAIAWQTSPLGTMVEATPDRMIVAGVVAAPSSLYVSASNSFLASGFTVGSLSSDAFIEPITAPGSKITHIRWGCGKLLWWKDQSFGYTQFEDQYTLENKIISDTIGTFDNTSAIDPGGNVWFRGQDGHIWRYDCSGLTKESIEITPNVQSSGRRTSNSFIQTTQSDWNGGSGNPANVISTTTIIDSITPTTFTVTENSSASVSGWALGTTSNVSVWTSSIALTLNNSGDVTNPSFESAIAGNWTSAGSPSFARVLSGSADCGTVTPQSGSAMASTSITQAGYVSSFTAVALDGTYLASVNIPGGTGCTWTQTTLTGSSHYGKRVKFRFSADSTAASGSTLTTSDSYIWGGPITFYYAVPPSGSSYEWHVDNIQLGSSTITSGQFTSQAFNTGSPYSFAFTSATWTLNTSTPSIVLQKSASASGPWLDINNSTGTNVQTNHRFLRYLSSFTVSGSEEARTFLSGVQIIAKSSGPYYSAVKNAPNITAWSTFNPTAQANDGSITYAIRRATQTFSVLSATPSATTALTPNSLITASTGTYFQVLSTFIMTAATNTSPSLSDFSVNWYEGTASDQSYMHYFDNAIWASVAFGVGVSSNTHIFKRDLITDGWTVYNFGAGGFATQNNRIYFGDVSTGGNVFIYGSGTSDNTSAINAYWKSKEYAGTDPFNENQLTQIDTLLRRDSNQTLTATYTVGTSTETAYTISLSSGPTTFITHRKTLPSGKNAYTFNIKYSNNSTTGAFELLGYRLGYIQYPWKPSQ